MRVSVVSIFIVFLLHSFALAQIGRNPLSDSLSFNGDHIIYKGEKIVLGPNAFYIDGRLSSEDASKYNFVFSSINEAAKHLTNGTETAPMVLYIAPYVYWIDNPDDTAVRTPKPGSNTPFGLEIKCQWLNFYGLTDDARNVVLASNRGQTIGAKGNFTMFNISGNGTAAENVTFGNYCNIDLEYPLMPSLGRKKRASAIVQAQLVFCDGDKLIARNTSFVSRLNLCPFIGGKRVLFDRCHFECTDDALNGSAVYLNCSFDFYSSKPFYRTNGTGAVFLNCDINLRTRGEQYFTKSAGQVAVIDTRFFTQTATYIGWRDLPTKESRNYQYNVSLNNKLITIGTKHPQSTIDMNKLPLLEAYKFSYRNKVIYNTYNLLRGKDDWDPMGIKQLVVAAQNENKKRLTTLPTQLLVTPAKDTIESGAELRLKTTLNLFGNDPLNGESIIWKVAPQYQDLVTLVNNEDGSCKIVGTNNQDSIREVIIEATVSSGLVGAAVVYVSPSLLDPPKFSSRPQIKNIEKGKLLIDYRLAMKFKDQSLISWYRCKKSNGDSAIEVSVSRFNVPTKTYDLTFGDVGYYMMAKISPKHTRCIAGEPIVVITKEPISAEQVKTTRNKWLVDLRTLPTKYQSEIKPGFWTMDCFAPSDTYDWTADNSKDPWYVGAGVDGAANDTGLVQANKGARVLYTPNVMSTGNMKISFTAVPSKTAGQGFSSARAQYMDVYIKMDTKTLTGYGVRFIRTTKYSDAIDVVLMKFTNGIAAPISMPVSTSCYRPNCRIVIEVKGNKLVVDAINSSDYYIVPNRPEVVQQVHLETEIQKCDAGGFGLQHTGTVGAGATLIKDLMIEWN